MEHERKVVPLPVLKGSTIEDTLSGFAPQIEQNAHLGTRVEHAITALAVEIRGWQKLADQLGPDGAERLRSQAVERVIEAIEARGGAGVSIGGSPTQPLVTATFSGDQHAMRAVVAAQTIRDTMARTLHPSLKHRLHACSGLNSGVVVETQVNGSAGVRFQATGTVRMFATRLQEFAGPDQIFLSGSTYRAVQVPIDADPIGPVRTNADGSTEDAFSFRGLAPRA